MFAPTSNCGQRIVIREETGPGVEDGVARVTRIGSKRGFVSVRRNCCGTRGWRSGGTVPPRSSPLLTPGADAVGGSGEEVRGRIVARGMLFRARTLILYLVLLTFGSGRLSNVLHARQRLLRFVRNSVATGLSSSLNLSRSLSSVWNFLCSVDAVASQPSSFNLCIAVESAEGLNMRNPSDGETASLIGSGFWRLLDLPFPALE